MNEAASQAIDPVLLANARANIYEILARAYAEPPQPDFLRLLAQWLRRPRMSAASGGGLSSEMDSALTALDGFLAEQADRTWEQLSDQLSVSFTRLFRGVKKEYSPPPPYESVYREEGGRVFGEVTAAVQSEYRRFGYKLADGVCNEPPDHLCFELAFENSLCSREAEAWEKRDDLLAEDLLAAQREFSEKHLLTWLPDLRDRVCQFDHVGFFTAMLGLTLGWVRFDYVNHLRSSQEDPFVGGSASEHHRDEMGRGETGG